MKLPRAIARVNRVFTNRIQGLWAPYLPPWVMLLHTGRRSGRSFHTPMLATVRGDEIIIGVLYGPESDWVRNVVTAGSASVIRLGRTRAIEEIRLVPKKDAGPLPIRARCLAAIADNLVIAHLS